MPDCQRLGIKRGGVGDFTAFGGDRSQVAQRIGDTAEIAHLTIDGEGLLEIADSQVDIPSIHRQDRQVGQTAGQSGDVPHFPLDGDAFLEQCNSALIVRPRFA